MTAPPASPHPYRTDGTTSLLVRPGARYTLVLIVLLGCLYIPFAGSYGLWDPWETHYGEVARAMIQRGDPITTYWQDEVFKSKPALTFWLQAIGMTVAGVNQAGAPASEMALSTAVEWGMRLPIVFVSIFCLWSIFLVVSRMAGRRAGIIAAIVCATCPQYALISRQSITDLPFVGFMTAGMCFFLLGLFSREDEPAPSYTIALGRRRLRITTWHIFGAFLLLLVIPQLVVFAVGIGWQKYRTFSIFGSHRQLLGFPYILPWAALLIFYFLSVRAQNAHRARHVYVHAAWMLCGLAVLAKGLGAILIPVAVVGIYLVFLAEARLVARLEILRGLAILLAVAAPWHHAMWVRHGDAFWNEYFGHHHFKRAQLGVHGQRGGVEYFLQQLGYGMFPWTALVPAAVLRWMGNRSTTSDVRARLVLYAVTWAGLCFALFSIMETKFHHYALPVIPPLAILIGVWLDDLLGDGVELRVRPGETIAIAAGLLLLVIIARDLVVDPQRFVVMFIYKYDRLFPYELGFETWLIALSIPLAVATAALLWSRLRRVAVWSLLGAAGLFAFWTINGYLVALSPHWGQKELHALYHKMRSGPEERLIAWQLNWRGENFYSKNQVVVHMQPKDTPKFKAYLQRHRGERAFVIMEQGRLASFKGILASLNSAKSVEIIGPGPHGAPTVWPSNWVPHFRSSHIKVLYRERATLPPTCTRWKAKLRRLPIPAGARRYRGSEMEDNWWGGHCEKFVKEMATGVAKTCRTQGSDAPACRKARRSTRRAAARCDEVHDALGPYPFRDCFVQYPNNKFLLARFTP